MRCLVLALCGIWVLPAFALSADKDQAVDIQADGSDMNTASGTSIFTGNVEIRQGSTQLNADKVTVYYIDSRPSKLIAIGKPAQFRQLPDDSKEYVVGKGNKIEYLINDEELVLTENAVLIQGKDTFKSDRIIYDRVKARLKAGAAAEGSQRVHITLDPNKNK
jgi:lipopolysaccharide export system protein LptA